MKEPSMSDQVELIPHMDAALEKLEITSVEPDKDITVRGK